MTYGIHPGFHVYLSWIPPLCKTTYGFALGNTRLSNVIAVNFIHVASYKTPQCIGVANLYFSMIGRLLSPKREEKKQMCSVWVYSDATERFITLWYVFLWLKHIYIVIDCCNVHWTVPMVDQLVHTSVDISTCKKLTCWWVKPSLMFKNWLWSEDPTLPRQSLPNPICACSIICQNTHNKVLTSAKHDTCFHHI